MTAPINNEDALRRYPELQQPVTVREAGWGFRPFQDDGGELEGVAGNYSGDQYTDALFIFDRTNVSAARVLDDAYGGGCVWSKEVPTFTRSSTNCSACRNQVSQERHTSSSGQACSGRRNDPNSATLPLHDSPLVLLYAGLIVRSCNGDRWRR